ncbi:MAG: hypothetical protein R3214_04985 [Christiangramia sp.]|nr:hypothetical protein [Christiangramia sp.]
MMKRIHNLKKNYRKIFHPFQKGENRTVFIAIIIIILLTIVAMTGVYYEYW